MSLSVLIHNKIEICSYNLNYIFVFEDLRTLIFRRVGISRADCNQMPKMGNQKLENCESVCIGIHVKRMAKSSNKMKKRLKITLGKVGLNSASLSHVEKSLKQNYLLDGISDFKQYIEVFKYCAVSYYHYHESTTISMVRCLCRRFLALLFTFILH